MTKLTREISKVRLKWLKSHLGLSRHWVLLSVSAGVLSALMMIFQAMLLAKIIYSAVFLEVSLEALWPLFIALVPVFLVRGVAVSIKDVCGTQASVTIRRELRQQISDKLIRLGPAYTLSQRSGDLSNLAIEQIEALDGFFARYLPQMALSLIIPLLIIAFVVPYNWAVVVIFLVTAPLVPLFMALVGMKAAEANQRNFAALSHLSAFFLDVLGGMFTLKLFNRSRHQEASLAKASDDFRQRTMQVLRLAFLSSAVLEFFSAISIAVVAVYLGMSFLGHLDFGSWSDSITFYEALFILLLAPEFYLPLRELGTHYHAKAEAIGAAGRIADLLSEPEPEIVSGDEVIKGNAIAVHLAAVSKRYTGQQVPVLDEATLTISAGEFVAIIGPSGSGKSTVLNLLLGFDQPNEGEIQINNRPLSRLNHEHWLQQVAWVSQHTNLFYGTIRDNLLIACPDASDEVLVKACQTAFAWEFIEPLPQQLDTHLGEGGFGLSGGQIQRLAIARVLLKDAPLVLLDEPTANLDKASEGYVLKAIEALAVGRTVIMLTHRLASQSIAQSVYRLSDGGFSKMEVR